MGEQRTTYKYTDDDGDEQQFVHVERWCRCMGNCESDSIEYHDPLEPLGSPPYRLNDINGTEMKGVIIDLIDMAVASGKLTKVQ